MTREDSHFAALLALAVIIASLAVTYGAVAQLVSTPRVHPDEHIYGGGGASLAEGDGLTLRGEAYGLGPVLPALLAAILWAAGDRETAYPLYKIANALLFVLAAIPIYLVARRLLRPWWSVGVAAFSIAIPSSMYIALVMTESASFLLFCTALLAIVLALERTTVLRQLAVLLLIGTAYATRAQFAVLLPAFLLGLAGTWALMPNRERLRTRLVGLWPTLGALALGITALVVRPLVTGSSPLDAIGAYEVLFRGYNPLDIAKWVTYHLADLEIYLAVVPIAVAPIVLGTLWRRARSGSRESAAFLTAFLAINACMLLVTAAFASTEFGFDRLHDRNIFYLVPLWLIVLGVWLADGMPRPQVATACGALAAFGLIAVLPFRYIASEVGVDVVPSALWAPLQESLAGEILTARKLLVLGIVSLVALVLVLPRRVWWILPAVMIASFSATAVFAWERIADAAENAVFEGAPERRWVDALVPENAHVTKVYLVTSECPASAVTWHALYLTEFFNRSIARAAYIGDSVPDGLPIRPVDVAPDGRLLDEDGSALHATHVLTQPGLTFRGSELGRGTSADLVLWRTDSPVRVVGAQSNADLRTADCS